MPTAILNRIPLPNLKVYTTISILLVSGCIQYAINSTKDPNWRINNSIQLNVPVNIDQPPIIIDSKSNDLKVSSDDLINGLENHDDVNNMIVNGIQDTGNEEQSNVSVDVVDPEPVHIESVDTNQIENGSIYQNETDTRSFVSHITDISAFMVQEPICVWVLINMAYCCLILLGKTIQKVVFGELRISEQQHLKDKFWNILFYKFIFVFGIVNVQFLHEVIFWASWFSILGFLHLLLQLSKDRYEYLSSSPTTPGWSHFRLVALLVAILTTAGSMFGISICIGYYGGLNMFAFMVADCLVLNIRTLHVLLRYAMFLYDMKQSGIANIPQVIPLPTIAWDKRGIVPYYIDLGFEIAAYVFDLLHYLHMLLWSNYLLSMASLLILAQIRYLSNEIQRKLKKHRNYLWVLNHMEKSYPLATKEELSQNSDNCAICWEKMDSARKLPCSHLFHYYCLQSWLEQDTSCPTCRLALSVQNINNNVHQNPVRIEEPNPTGRINNHFFHFHGSRYASWLPNFSVEVTNINNVLRNNNLTPQTANHTSQLRNMANQIQQIFPLYTINELILNLSTTLSMEATIDEILEGRLDHLVEQVLDEHQNVDRNRNDLVEIDNIDEGEPSTSTGAPSSITNSINNGPYTVPNDYYVNPNDYGISNSDSSTSDDQLSNSMDSGYEIERNSNIFGSKNDLLRDVSTDDLTVSNQFLTDSAEREKLLQNRKEKLLALSRKRYLETNKSNLNVSTPSTSTNI